MDVIFLSGGMESVLGFKRYIEQYGNSNVMVVYMDVANSMRTIAEKQVVTALCHQNQVPLHIFETQIEPCQDYTMLSELLWSVHFYYTPITRAFFGYSGLGAGLHYSDIFKYMQAQGDRIASYRTVKPEMPELTTLIDGMDRAAIAAELGNYPYWSCRQPNLTDGQFTACGRCGTCGDLIDASVMHPVMPKANKTYTKIGSLTLAS